MEADGAKLFKMEFFLIPVENIILPLLHITLGLVNDACNAFFKWLDKSLEPMTAEEQEVQTMAIIAELAVDNGQEDLEHFEELLQETVRQQIDVNKALRVWPLVQQLKAEL